VLDGENMSPSRGALRPVTLSQGIVATDADLKVRAARVNKMRYGGLRSDGVTR